MEQTIILNKNTQGIVRKYLPSNAVLADMCNFFAVFSDVTRIKMLSALSIVEMCVTDLATILELNQTTVSHQLRILRDAGFVSTRRDGKIIYYTIVNNHINDIMMTGAEYLGF